LAITAIAAATTTVSTATAVTRAFAVVAAGFATGGFVLKTFLGIEFLFTGCEREIDATVLTLKGLVCVTHDSGPFLVWLNINFIKNGALSPLMNSFVKSGGITLRAYFTYYNNALIPKMQNLRFSLR
jgi:hypothetical protein